MSEVAAIEPFGEFHSALFYRDLFLRDEVRYNDFACPFCGVPLDDVLIYEPHDAEMAKSPHFRTKRNGVKHLHGCDGNPSNYQRPREHKAPESQIEKQLFTFPTEFVEYVERLPNPAANRPARIPTAEEIQRRREAGARNYGQARFRVSLVQSIAEAHMGTVQQAFDLQKQKGWDNAKRNAWLTQVLAAPLNLRGFPTTYKKALHDLYFSVAEYPRIYYGKNGIVKETETGYDIIAEQSGFDRDENQRWPFAISIARQGMDVANLRGARRAVMAQLQRAVDEKLTVRWYGFGRAERMNGYFELGFGPQNLGDLFIKLGKPQQSS